MASARLCDTLSCLLRPPSELDGRRPLSLLLVLLGCTLLVAACSNGGTALPTGEPLPAPRRATGESLPKQMPVPARAERNYHRHCADCHGKGGDGNGWVGRFAAPKPSNFLEMEARMGRSPADYHRAIAQGVQGSGMQPWGHVFTDDEVWDLAYYVWSLPVDLAMIERGQQAFESSDACFDCPTAGDAGEIGALRGRPELAAISASDFFELLTEVQLDVGSDVERQELYEYLASSIYVDALDSETLPQR